MIVCSIRVNDLRAVRTTIPRPREKALWLMQSGDGHIGEFFNINPSATQKGRIANLEDYTDGLPICLCLPLQWLNECLDRDKWKDLRQHGQ